ncbi:MAG TPA: ATP-binding cassette domain-containing protein, partial [Candidatus Limnocylindrales bacterium]|nr:ATP-binding cassette domain-containing protein [Candidatus Limnocylindrales bacterium]
MGAGMEGTNRGFATPTIKGRLRLRPNAHILRARSILITLPILTVGLAVGALLLSLVFREPAAGIGSLPDKPGIVVLIWPAYVVSAIAYAATRGFRDRALWSLALAGLVGIVLVGGGIFMFLSTTNAPAATGGTPSGSGALASPAATVGATIAAPTPGASVAAGASPGASGDIFSSGGTSSATLSNGNAAFGLDALAFLFIVLGAPLLWNLWRGISWFTAPQAKHEVLTAEHIEGEAGGLSPIVAPLTEIAAETYTEAKLGEPLLSVRGLKKHFPILGGVLRRRIGTIYAVDGVDFDVRQGEVFAVVGESGCGKTTLGRTLLQLTPPTAGHVIYDGYELGDVDPDDMRPLRRRMQIIFQDPFGSLNPRMPISDIIGEGLLAQGVTKRAERDKRVEDSLEVVGLRRDYTRRYPHEFSGGQRQRIGIARALALSPDFIVCDEPVSALDVSIQSQVLNLLLDLKRDFNLTYMFISHNLSVVEYFSDRIAVMYLGRIVELGTVNQLYRNARHPYTVALLSAIPDADPRKRRRRLVLKGDVP